MASGYAETKIHRKDTDEENSQKIPRIHKRTASRFYTQKYLLAASLER